MTASPKTPDRAPRRRARHHLFRVGLVLVPVVFFALLEGGLRLAGFGASYPLFVPVPEFSDYLYQNREVARRYFAQQANVPTSAEDVFLAEKDSTIYRIFVQGGSSAAGYPYYRGGSFSRMLEQRLQQTYPGRTIEVVNTAMAAVNSYTMLDFADEILAHRPDAVVIYAGHNEYYGALGVGSAESLGQYRAVVNTYLKLQDLRIVQGLRALLAGVAGALGGGAGAPPAITLMERMVGEQAIPYGTPLYVRGLRQFEGNLRALLARYQRAGVPVLIGTVASNERTQPPFIGTPTAAAAAAWTAAYRQGQDARQQGDGSAAAAFQDAIRLDSSAADAFFALARLHDDQGRYAEARPAYLAAKDRDQLRFRAPEAINDIIRAEAAVAGAQVVETHAALIDAAQDGLIGHDLMLEHLHPNVDGYFVLANAFYTALMDGVVPRAMAGRMPRVVPAEQARAEVLVTAVDSLNGHYRVQTLMGSWPFQPVGTVDRSMDTLQARTPVEALALDLYREKANWYDTTSRLRAYYQQQGDHHRALQAALALIQQYPFLPAPYAEAADILARQRRFDEALTYYAAANDREESTMVYYMMGAIYLARQDVDAAINHLERALALDPRHQQALFQLSRAYAARGAWDEATQHTRRLLTLAPGHTEAQQLLAWLNTRRNP